MKKILRVSYDAGGIFVRRLNRFLGQVKLNGRIEYVHIHDPGRINYLVPGSKVLLKEMSGDRKTNYDLIGVIVNEEIIFTNSRYHNLIAERLLEEGIPFKPKRIEKEIPIGESRIDFLVDGVPFEVKGCTLLEGSTALFPDSITERGTRHLLEIANHHGILLFLVFRPARCFAPNKLDIKFYNEFKKNLGKFKSYQLKLLYDGEWIKYVGEIPLCESF